MDIVSTAMVKTTMVIVFVMYMVLAIQYLSGLKQDATDPAEKALIRYTVLGMMGLFFHVSNSILILLLETPLNETVPGYMILRALIDINWFLLHGFIFWICAVKLDECRQVCEQARASREMLDGDEEARNASRAVLMVP
jgi:hypothetical protein